MRLLGLLAATATLLTVGYANGPPLGRGPDAVLAAPTTSAHSSDVVHIPFFIQDAGGQPPTASPTPLFEIRKHNPITAPDGRQITMAEFAAVEGTVSVQCVAAGTEVTLQLRNLIPNGLYTIWNVVFKAPGFDPTFANMIGLGALGAPIGTENVFRASASGAGTISTTTSAGPLSMKGSIGACGLVDEFEWHVVGAYHIDGRSHGATLGPDGTAVEQFGFIFKR